MWLLVSIRLIAGVVPSSLPAVSTGVSIGLAVAAVSAWLRFNECGMRVFVQRIEIVVSGDGDTVAACSVILVYCGERVSSGILCNSVLVCQECADRVCAIIQTSLHEYRPCL